MATQDSEFQPYIQELKAKFFAKRTIEEYSSVLRHLERYFQKRNRTLLALHKNDLREYIIHLGASNNIISINHHLTIIRAFYTWCLDRGGITTHPCAQIQSLQADKPLPVFLVQAELSYLYKLIDEDNTINVQDVTMLDVLVGTGMRTTEMCNLKTTDYFDYKGTGFFKLRVTKGGNEREVAMADYTRDQVKKFIHGIELRGYKENWLFPNSEGGQLTRQAAYNRIERMLRKVKNRKKGGHTLRHTFATLALHRKVKLKAIQMQLGHKDPNTTALYTHLDMDRMVEIYKSAHPKERAEQIKSVTKTGTQTENND